MGKSRAGEQMIREEVHDLSLGTNDCHRWKYSRVFVHLLCQCTMWERLAGPVQEARKYRHLSSRVDAGASQIVRGQEKGSIWIKCTNINPDKWFNIVVKWAAGTRQINTANDASKYKPNFAGKIYQSSDSGKREVVASGLGETIFVCLGLIKLLLH